MQKSESELFSAYLKKIAGVSPKHIQYYVRWVAEYFRSNELAQTDRKRALQCFQHQLERTRESWKVNQALNAVRHYWFWKDRLNSQGHATCKDAHGSEELLNETKHLLRLQHKSYRTEQTYLGWIKRFLAQVQPTGRFEIRASHLRHYLSYLAVERRVSASTQQQAFNAILFLYTPHPVCAD
jgi:hypothetical protein